MTLYDAYLAGWNACLAGVDGRYWFTRPEEIEREASLRRAWCIGWEHAFDREDDDEEPLPANWLSLEDFCGEG
jgi:hypothetical protein